jgi:hypothetical protein
MKYRFAAEAVRIEQRSTKSSNSVGVRDEVGSTLAFLPASGLLVSSCPAAPTGAWGAGSGTYFLPWFVP